VLRGRQSRTTRRSASCSRSATVAVAARACAAGSVALGSSRPSMVRRVMTASFQAWSICGPTRSPVPAVMLGDD
jgi:hypothetical protein